MKATTYLYIVFSLLFCSCSSTYYYATLDSTNHDLEKIEEQNGDFIYENDSLWIAYCFKGEDAPIQITIYNKLDIPLYADWDRSALIIDNTAYSYNDHVSKQFKESESTTYESWFGSAKTYTNTFGTSKSPQSISFIPPKSKITHQSLRLSAKFDDINMKNYIKSRVRLERQDRAVAVPILSMKYDKQDSPLHFSSFLTVYTNPEKQQTYKSDFYTSRLIKTGIKPKDLPLDMGNRGDIFYQCKRPNNTGWNVLGVTTLVVGATALNVLVADKDQEY